ncbi:2898_t:CDS:1, partial [Paraglomus occultum]
MTFKNHAKHLKFRRNPEARDVDDFFKSFPASAWFLSKMSLNGPNRPM